MRVVSDADVIIHLSKLEKLSFLLDYWCRVLQINISGNRERMILALPEILINPTLTLAKTRGKLVKLLLFRAIFQQETYGRD